MGADFIGTFRKMIEAAERQPCSLKEGVVANELSQRDGLSGRT